MSLQYPKGVDLHQVTPHSHWHVEGLLTAQAMERTVGPSLSLCPPDLCYKYPSWQKKSPLSPKTLSETLVWHCGANLPTATEEKAGWKVAGTWAEEGPPAAGTHQCEATKQGEVGKSLQSQPCLDKSRGASHVYTTLSDLNQKKRNKENWAGDTHLRTPLCAMSSEAQRDKGKRKWKRIHQWLKPIKSKFCLKKLTMIQPFQCQKAWNSKDRICHSCWWHDSTYRTEKNLKER